MNFQFEVEETILIAEALFGKNAYALEDWESLKNALWKDYKIAYEFFLYREVVLFFANDSALEQLRKVPNQTEALFDKVRKSKEYEKLLEKTEKYKAWLEKEWEDKKDIVLKELEDILRVDLPVETFKVAVLAPELGNGINIGDKILWGHTEDWENYSLVYLVHEALHSLFGKSELEHALIELIADNELRIRLNGGDVYHSVAGDLEGHASLLEIKKELLDSWNVYLESQNQNIYEYLREIRGGNILSE
ncbi:hypothetical protein GF360_03835 [candidate division WWE3 bacterium]|nr:hypothetical protein [candidate division WWE3 bacterium]